jgi:hypothetical protein
LTFGGSDTGGKRPDQSRAARALRLLRDSAAERSLQAPLNGGGKIIRVKLFTASLAAAAVTFLVLGGTAAAVEGVQGVHGAATHSQVPWIVVVDVNRVPSGALAGAVQFFVFEFAANEARPILVVAGDTACVVSEVTRFSGDIGYTRVLLIVTIRDVAGGPDLFSVTITLNVIPGHDYCPDNPPAIPVGTGNFTIIG